MADLVQRVKDLATRIGTEFKSVRTSIAAAQSLAQTANTRALVDDTTAGSTTMPWSGSKSAAQIAASAQATKDAILGGASAAYDTLGEIQQALATDETAAAALTAAVNNRLRFDAPQTLAAAAKTQVCQNAGIGEPDSDFVATFVAAIA
jgi:hypothetical protein